MHKKTIQIRITPSLFDALADASENDDRSKAQYIVSIIKQDPLVKKSIARLEAHACITQTSPATVMDSPTKEVQVPKVAVTDTFDYSLGQRKPQPKVPSYDTHGNEIE